MKLKTLYELASFCAERYSDTVGFVDGDVSKTYKEFFDDTVSVANKLLDMGLEKQHIAVCGANSYGWVVAYFAVSYIGAALPVGDDTYDGELAALCEAARCPAVITCDYAGDIENGDLLVIKWQDLALKPNISAIKEPNTEDVAVLVPTSGTMGKCRLCMLTHKSIMADVCAAVATVDFHGNTVAILPFHHSFGMLGGVFVAMYNGARIAVCSAIHRMYTVLAKEAPRYLFIVPAIADGIRNEVERDILKRIAKGVPEDLAKAEGYQRVKKILGGNCEFAIVGGAPASVETEEFFSKTSVALCQGYGLTECSPAVSVNPPEKRKIGSVGKAMEGITVSVLDPDEKGCGEIAVSGDVVMAGYYNAPEANEEVFSCHGLLTGDLGRVDEDGYIFIMGRKKNLIILPNGKNVMPEELEDKLCSLRTVEEALVYDCGNVIGAKVYTMHEDVCKEEIEQLNLTLPMYKRISQITFVHEPLARNSLKKLIRRKD